MIEIQRTRIDVEAVVDSVRRNDAGAIVVFLGTVRADPDVRALDYEVYQSMAVLLAQQSPPSKTLSVETGPANLLTLADGFIAAPHATPLSRSSDPLQSETIRSRSRTPESLCRPPIPVKLPCRTDC